MTLWHPNETPYAEFVKQHHKGIRGLASLFELLTYLRIAKTEAEADFVQELLRILPDNTHQDNYGNIIVTIGNKAPITLFSCHTDMVSTEKNSNRQTLMFTDTFYLKSANSNQLGADDGAGIWLMLNMIDAQVPGLYIFHREEEPGGLGSRHIRDNEPKLLSNIQQAVAFDRRGTNSIITHMLCERCCSDDFASALSRKIGMNHSLDESGFFTDVMQYADLIPQCTNISVGYMNEHLNSESLNFFYLQTLRSKLLAVDWQTVI
jgi:hypothetical protein